MNETTDAGERVNARDSFAESMARFDESMREVKRLTAEIERPGGTLDRIAIIIGQKDWRARPRKRPITMSPRGNVGKVLQFPAGA